MSCRCEQCDVTISEGAEKACSRCKKVAYCNKDCQKKNWPVHSRYCVPYYFGKVPSGFEDRVSLKRVVDCGNFAVAQQDFFRGTKIFDDQPVAYIYTADVNAAAKERNSEDKEDYLFGKNVESKKASEFIADPAGYFPEFCDDPQKKLVWCAVKKAPWLAHVKEMRIPWNEDFNANRLQTMCLPRSMVSQGFLESVCKELNKQQQGGEKESSEQGTNRWHPVDIYKISFWCGNSFSEIHSLFKSTRSGFGIFRFAWALTPSCDPNCLPMWSEGKIHLVALKNVMVGDILTVGWNPLLLLRDMRDRTLSLRLYHGVKVCPCERCRRENPATKAKTEAEKTEAEKTEAEKVVPRGVEGISKARRKAYANQSFGVFEDATKEEIAKGEMEEDFYDWTSKLSRAFDCIYKLKEDDTVSTVRKVVTDILETLSSWKSHDKLIQADMKNLAMLLNNTLVHYHPMVMLGVHDLMGAFQEQVMEICKMTSDATDLSHLYVNLLFGPIEKTAFGRDAFENSVIAASLLPYKMMYYMMLTHMPLEQAYVKREKGSELDNDSFKELVANSKNLIIAYKTQLLPPDVMELLSYEIAQLGLDTQQWEYILGFYPGVYGDDLPLNNGDSEGASTSKTPETLRVEEGTKN